jgi:hypothetical protein
MKILTEVNVLIVAFYYVTLWSTESGYQIFSATYSPISNPDRHGKFL